MPVTSQYENILEEGSEDNTRLEKLTPAAKAIPRGSTSGQIWMKQKQENKTKRLSEETMSKNAIYSAMIKH